MAKPIHAVVKASQLPAGVLERSTLRGAADVASCWIAILAAVVCIRLVAEVWVFVAAFVVISLFQMRLLNLGHHSFHQDLSATRAINNFLGRWLLLAPMMGLFTATRRNHLLHHKLLGNPNDPESEVYNLEKFGRNTRRGLVLWWAGKLLGARFFPLLKNYYLGLSKGGQATGRKVRGPSSSDQAWDLVALVTCQIVLALAFYACSGLWWAYLVLWIAPGLTLTSLMLAIRSFSEHVSTENPPNYVATFFCGFAERFSLGSFNFHMHAEHHFFPSVPYYHLPEVRRKLLEENAFALIGTRCLPSYFRPVRDTFMCAR